MANEFSEDKKSLVCRVCLKCVFEIDLGPGLSLFEKYNDCVISDQINELTNISIKEGDGFPDRICPTCHLQLQSAYKFKKTCENTNEILLSTAKHVLQKCKGPVEIIPVKKECLDDDNDADADDNVNDNDDNDDNVDDNDDNVYDNDVDDNVDDNEECLDDDNDANADDNVNDNDNYDNVNDNDADENVDDNLLNKLQDVKIVKKHKVDRPSRAIDLKLECHDCGGIFKSKCKLLTHWKKTHMKCFRCSRVFKKFSALKTHKKKNLKSCVTAGNFNIEGEGKARIFHCKKCDYKTKVPGHLKGHVLKHSDNNPYKCHICSRTYSSTRNVQRHLEGAHKLYTYEGTCQHCGKHIKGKIKMDDHLKKSHTYKKKEQFECKICKSMLASKSSLWTHMKKHSGVKAYVCEICSKSFYTAGSLYCHRTKTHFKSKSYTCDICGFISYWHTSMSRHNKKHSGPGVACNICGKFVDNEVQLSMHKLRHTERHHQCSHCDKKFFSRSLLCKHIRKVHKVSLAK